MPRLFLVWRIPIWLGKQWNLLPKYGGYSGNAVGFWDLSTNRNTPQILFDGPINVAGIAIHPDGKTVAAGMGDGTIRIWDITNPDTSPTILQGHTDVVTAVDYNSGGTLLVSSSEDQTVRLWPSLDNLVDMGCKRVWRNLTPLEWWRYLPDEPYRATCPNLSVE